MSKRALQVVSDVAKRFHAKAMLAGSITRGTWLPFKMEFEVFVLFPPTLSKRKLADSILKIGKEAMKRLGGGYRVQYAEHPYVSGFVGGMGIDIVPCYEVSSPKELKSAVDRTPFHVKYLNEHLPASLIDEVRLLKHFLAVHELYGADAKTQGFSGYLCELLVLNYQGFINVLKAVAQWEPAEVVDIENYYTRKEWPRIRKRFRGEPLIVIDPTDPERNVASAVSAKKFYLFKELAQNFLAKPSMEFFYPKRIRPMSETELKKKIKSRQTELLVVRFKPPDVVPDVLWPQLRRFAVRLKSILEEYEFKVLGMSVWSDESKLATVLLEMEIARLPAIQKRIGPPIFDRDDSKRFLKKYADKTVVGPYVENNRWCVEVKRRWRSAKEKLVDTLSEEVKVLKAKGIPGYVAEELAKGFKVLQLPRIARLGKKETEFGIFLRKYFEKI
jgi:tRNA nucleotidyltransferase (CCA-adding enzyme)